MSFSSIQELYSTGFFSGLDYHFAKTIGGLAKEENPLVLLAAAAVSRATAQGHVCLEIESLAGNPILSEEGRGGRWPEKEEWLAALEKSPLTARNQATAPLALDDGNRLYLARYWDYQERLLEQLKARAEKEVAGVDRVILGKGLLRLFGEDGAEPDMQKIAAETSVLRHLTVISGGPGTGKTHTVVKILQLILAQALAKEEKIPKILLAAPTGKAAARLKESISLAKAKAVEALCKEDECLDQIPEEAATIHRMLGMGKGRGAETVLLNADVVVVDEASMVDLSLMTKLMEAVPADARLILLGDKDQLASVEAGAILGDICKGAEGSKGEIAKCIVNLTRSYRFDAGAGIGKLAAAVRDGDVEGAISLLEAGNLPGVTFIPVQDDGRLSGILPEIVRNGYLSYFQEEETSRKCELFNSFRILCAHRQGRFGVEGINARVESLLLHEAGMEPGRIWYPGRPVMVEQNDYQMNLFNGDVGVTVTQDNGELAVYFPGSGEDGRRMLPSRLPPHRTVFAMTVHKSQGSEFDEVVLILPPGKSPVVTRELLYTAITRAKKSVTIIGDLPVIRDAVATPVQRASGLSGQLDK